jgi:hypothetical protein
MEEIVNKIAQSGLITFDLEKYYPQQEMVIFDLKDFLFMELILKEKDYREKLKNFDWSIYKNKSVGVTCSADAIIPMWAYMLAVTYLQPVADEVIFADEAQLFNFLFLRNMSAIDPKDFEDKRVVIKGCGDKKIPEAAYVEITKILLPVAKNIMYGEACSTVPLFKKK